MCDTGEPEPVPKSPNAHAQVSGATPELELVNVTEPGGLQMAKGDQVKLATGGL
jgi:hypothetical protein